MFLKFLNSFCPGTFAPALVPGQKDTGTRFFFVPGQRDNGTSRAQYAPSKLQHFLNKTRHFDIMWGIGEPSMHRCLFLSSAPASFCPKYPLQHPLQSYMYEQLHSVYLQYTHIQARQVIRKPFTDANAPFLHIL